MIFLECGVIALFEAFYMLRDHYHVTNNMIFLECGVIALFEAFYMLRDHNHVKMKFWNVKSLYLIL